MEDSLMFLLYFLLTRWRNLESRAGMNRTGFGVCYSEYIVSKVTTSPFFLDVLIIGPMASAKAHNYLDVRVLSFFGFDQDVVPDCPRSAEKLKSLKKNSPSFQKTRHLVQPLRLLKKQYERPHVENVLL